MSGDTDSQTASGRLVFRSDLPDSFGRYHDLIAETGAASSRTGESFEAASTSQSAPGLMLFDRQVVGVEHLRDWAHIRRDGFEHFYLQVLRSGMLMAGAPGDERWLVPGDAVLMDATRPMRSVVAAADYVTVVLARPVIEAIVPDARRLHGRRIPGAVSHGLGDAVLSLVRRARGLDVGDLAAAGQMLADILSEIAGPVGARDDTETCASKRLRAGLFIEAHVGRADLCVGAVATGVGMSRSALYRAFEPVGGVEREITRRRVARFRSALLQPGESRSLERLAGDYGFSSLSHCLRLFKETYGTSPGACREAFHGARGLPGAVLRNDDLRARYGTLGSHRSTAHEAGHRAPRLP